MDNKIITPTVTVRETTVVLASASMTLAAITAREVAEVLDRAARGDVLSPEDFLQAARALRGAREDLLADRARLHTDREAAAGQPVSPTWQAV